MILEISHSLTLDNFILSNNSWGIWLAQSEEHETLGLRVVSLSPTLGVEITCIHTYSLKTNDNSSYGENDGIKGPLNFFS